MKGSIGPARSSWSCGGRKGRIMALGNLARSVLASRRLMQNGISNIGI